MSTDTQLDLNTSMSFGISQEMQEKIKDFSENDPIYKQFYPSVKELAIDETERTDPIGDYEYEVADGLIHRYDNRVLFKVANHCAVYCRFCFRKNMIGQNAPKENKPDIKKGLAYIQENKNVREVILSGGDPLILTPSALQDIIHGLNQIDHVKILRIHTRIPIASPDILSHEKIAAISTFKGQTYIVLHVNHVNEIGDKALSNIRMLQEENIHLLSQTALLKGVNDNIECLCNLLSTLSENGIKPYYLHHLDKATGTSHFRISIQKGRALYKSLYGKISGHSIPLYMLDIPSGFGKIPINDDFVIPHKDGGYILRDMKGNTHRYYD